MTNCWKEGIGADRTRRLTRRSLIGAAAATLTGRAATVDVSGALDVNDLDREIWKEELEDFVPSRIWDAHAHIGLDRFDLDPNKQNAKRHALKSGQLEKVATLDTLQACDAALYPGRKVTPFILPNPYQYCDCKEINSWAAEQVQQLPDAVSTMVVQPGMSTEYIDRQVRRHRFVGFKPYMWYSTAKNWRESRITEFLPEHQLEVANQYGLVMALHLSKRGAIGDPENLADLERLSMKYPRVRWLLLHNARCYYDRPMEKAAPRLGRIPNVWLESSSVCEADAFYATFTGVGVQRFCYGSDDIPVGITRGKYISWGHAWEQLDDYNFTAKIEHCDGRKTFVRYEMLRALKRAAKYAGLSRQQIDDIFYGNAARLVQAVRHDLDQALGTAKRA